MLFWFAGGALALVVGTLLARREGLPPGRVLLALGMLGVVTYAGARVHALLLEEGQGMDAVLTLDAWRSWGVRLPGGVAAAIAVGPLVARGLGLPYWRFSDVAVVAGAALIGVGRIACHVAGCCIGGPSTLPWAVTYGPGSVAHLLHLQRAMIDDAAGRSLPVHPLGLYMSLAAFAILVGLLWLGRRGTRDGTRFLCGLTLVGLAFGTIEQLRDGFGDRPELYREQAWLAIGATAALVWLVRSYALPRVERPSRASWGYRGKGRAIFGAQAVRPGRDL